MDPFVLAIAILGLGIMLWVVVMLLRRTASPFPSAGRNLPQAAGEGEAVLLVREGGQVAYLSEAGRAWFGCEVAEPNLERLARQVRPVEAFLGLFSAAGTARFTIAGETAEAESFVIPYNPPNWGILVRLRRVPEISLPSNKDRIIFPPEGTSTERAEEVVQAGLQRLVAEPGWPEDVLCGVSLWDAEARRMAPWVSSSPLEQWSRAWREQIVNQRSVLSSNDTSREPLLQGGKAGSYLGVPLLVGDELVGALELASYTRGAFTSNHQQAVEAYAGQAALFLRLARLERVARRLDAEQVGLARLERASAEPGTLEQICQRLADVILSLREVEGLGFWLWDPDVHPAGGMRALQPFIGFSVELSDLYTAAIMPGSPGFSLLRSGEIILAHPAAEDTRLKNLGLDLSCRAAGFESVLCIPLLLGHGFAGYLLVADKKDGTPFDTKDVRLYTIAAAQAAGALQRATVPPPQPPVSYPLRKDEDRLAELARAATGWRALAAASPQEGLQPLLERMLEDFNRMTRASGGSLLLLDPIRENSGDGVVAFAGLPHPPQLSPQESAAVHLSQPSCLSSGEELLVPIPGPEGLPLGLLCLKAETEGTSAVPAFGPTEMQAASALSAQAALVLDLAQAAARAVAQSQRFSALRSAAQAALALDWETWELALRQAIPGTHVHKVEVHLPSAESNNEMDAWPERLHPEDRLDRLTDIAGSQASLSSTVPVYFLPPATSEQAASLVFQLPGGGILDMQLLPGEKPQADVWQAVQFQAALIGKMWESREQLLLRDRSLDRLQGAASAVSALLGKDLQAGLAVGRLSSRLGWMQAGMELAGMLAQPQIPSRVGDGDILSAMAQGLTEKLDFDAVLVAESYPGRGGPRLIVSIPSGGRPFGALMGQHNPLRTLLGNLPASEFLSAADLGGLGNEHREQTLPNEIRTTSWAASPLLQALEARSFVCFSIPAEAPTAVLAVSRQPLPLLAESQGFLEGLFGMLAGQAAAALSARRLQAEADRRLQEVDVLLEFTRATAQLGSLDAGGLLAALVDSTLRLVPSASAGCVATPDPRNGGLTVQAAAGYPGRESALALSFPQSGEGCAGQAFERGIPIRRDEVIFPHDYPLSPEDLARYRDATRGKLPVSSLAVPVGDSPVRGILLLENFTSPAAFSAQEEGLVLLLARQAALGLEAARLYQAASGRLEQLSALSAAAARLATRLHTRELVDTLLDEVASIVPYDTGTLWLRPTQGGRGRDLVVRAARGFPDQEDRLGLSVALAESQLLGGMAGASTATAPTAGRPVLVPDVRLDPRFPPILTLASPRYLSWLGVPLMVQGELVGAIALEKAEAGFYTPVQVQALMTFASSAAAALDNARLYEESLARAAELDRRSTRLALLNRLSTELGASLDATYILELTLQELLLAVGAAGGCAILFDTAGEVLLQAEAPPDPLNDLPVIMPSAPLFDHLRQTLGVYSLADLPDNTLRSPELGSGAMVPPGSPLHGYLAGRGAHGLLVLPLVTGNDLHGLLLIYHSVPHMYTPEEVELARTIGNQAAVAVQNASLFQETQWLFAETRARSAELATLFDLGVNISQVLDRERLVELTFENILHLLSGPSSVGISPGAGLLSISLLIPEPDSGAVEDGDPNSIQALTEQSLERPSPEADFTLVGPRDVANDSQDPRIHVLISGLPRLAEAGDWLGVPLVVRGAVTGVLSARVSPLAGSFSEAHLRLFTQIGNQLAVALDNARLFSAVQGYASELEQRVVSRSAELSARTEQLAMEHQRTSTLLGIITELSTSLDMDIVLNRTLALINETVGAMHSMILLVLPDAGLHRLFLRAALPPSGVPKGGEPTNILPDQDLPGWVISQRQPALVADLREDGRWGGSLPGVESHRSAIAVPLMMGEETLGALLLFHDEPARFSPLQLDLVQATAKQIAVAINNAQLYTLIRDQAERLGELLRRQHVETSRSQAILEAVADGVLVADANQVITLFNASAERILGLRREAVIGQSLERFLGLFGHAGQGWLEAVRRWSAGASPEPVEAEQSLEEEPYTVQIELEDLRVVSVHLSPVRLRSDFLGTVSTFRDITHQVVVDRLKSEFVATVSHELRTPMTSIKGYVEVLLMGAAGTLSEQQTRFLEIVRANAERLAVLVNDLLDISRIEAGRVTLSLQPLDMRQLAHEALADLERRNADQGKGMHIQLILPPDGTSLPRVLGDAERVHQMLDNLLDNAFAYTPPGGHIRLHLSHIGDEVQVDVQDDGIGIHPADQPRIFERFYRGEDPLVLATSGTGLGLSIVRHLVEMHHGRIWLKSSGIPGEGSTFTFTLPVYQP